MGSIQHLKQETYYQFKLQAIGKRMEGQPHLIKRIKIWFETTSFKNIKIGERFELPNDPNIYLKDEEYGGIEGGGMRVFCGPGVRVKTWPKG